MSDLVPEQKANPNQSDAYKLRMSWNVGSKVAVYSEIKNEWVLAEIIKIYEDKDGEWLVVQYNQHKTITKEIQRFSNEIRSVKQMHKDMETKQENESDILIMIKHNKRTLFDVNRSDFYDEEIRVKRIKCILLIYSLWIENHKKKQHLINNHNLNMNEIIDQYLDSEYDSMKFLSDYRFVCNLRRDLMRDDEDICNANLCNIIDRNERDRRFYGENEDKLMDLYHIAMDYDQHKDDSIKNIATQQMLDDLHTFVYHSLHINVNDDILDDLKVNNEDDSDNLCNDLYTQKLSDIINAEKQSSNRYRSTERSGNNKFITTNNMDNNTSNPLLIFKQICFIDVLIRELIKNNINILEIQFIQRFVFNEDYDSDGIMNYHYGFKINKLSNKCIQIINKLIKEKEIKKTLYSSGKQFYYWPFYEHNNDTKVRIFGSATYHQNVGHTLHEWFIPQKYDDLKDELLNNLICSFTLVQFNTTMIKAKVKLDAWNNDKDIKNIQCTVTNWERLYGIKKGDDITLQHIMSILFYTNFSDNCTSFSSTFRKCYEYETDEIMKTRHKEVRIWAKLIRETVEVFGTSLSQSTIDPFYHGVSDTMIFDSTYLKLYGPVSTTADFNIAVGIFGEDGIVVELQNFKGGLRYFDCPFWSDFTAEDEKLFCGGLQPFTFNTIRNMKLNPKQNYSLFVGAIGMFQTMIRGLPWKQCKILGKHCAALKLLISEKEMKASKVPQYISKFFNYLTSNIKHIEINWTHMNKQMYFNNKYCGYKAFSSLFCNTDCTSLDFHSLLRVLPNIEKIQLFHHRMLPIISLDEYFLSNLLSSIKFINNSSSLSDLFKSFDIFNPSDDITHFINTNNPIFNENGWNLSKTKMRPLINDNYGECDGLCIERV